MIAARSADEDDMSDSGQTALEARFERGAKFAGTLASLIGAVGLAGWTFEVEALKSVLPGLVTMKANTAFGLLFAGLSLRLQSVPQGSQRRRRLGRLFALGVVALGLLTLAEYLFRVDLGIDQLVFEAQPGELGTSHPGRMAPNTALGLVLTSTSLALLDAPVRWPRALSVWLAVIGLLLSLVAIAGYLYGARALYEVGGYTSMALHTSIALAVLAVGTLLSRPRRGPVAALAQNNRAGAAVRRLLPLIVATPVAMGFVVSLGERTQSFRTEFGLALMVTMCVVVLTFDALRNARTQGIAEGQSEQSLRDERFLFELDDSLRNLDDAASVLEVVSARVGAYLGVSRCFVAEIELASRRLTIARDYHAGLPSIAGARQLSAHNVQATVDASAGLTLVSEDTKADPKTAPDYAREYAPLDIRARVAVPFHREGKWVSTLVVSSHEPRVWKDREVSLVRKIAGRVWLRVERLRAEAALRESEERFRALVDASAQIVWSTPGKGEARVDSPSWREFTGQTREQSAGSGWLDALHPEDRDGAAKLWREAVDKDRPFETEYRIWHKGGSWRATTTRAVPLHNPDGSVREWVCMSIDVTERRAAEEASRRADKLLERSRFFELSLDLVCIANMHGHFLELNPQFTATLGYAREEFLTRPFIDFVHPDDRTATLREVEKLAQGQRTLDFTNRYRCKDGTERSLQWRAAPTDAGLIYAIARDVTEELSRTRRLAANLKEREVLLQEVHHRVKNNLFVIASLIEMQIRQVSDASAHKALEECQSRVYSIALIHESLHQSRDYSSIPLFEYVRDLGSNVFDVTGVSPDSVALNLKVEPLTLALGVDKAVPCGLILNELITNALKHAFRSGRQGTVEVELCRTSESEVRLSVADDGDGLPGDFDVRKAKSLGMQLVSALVEQLDGKLEIARGGGVSFSVTFPASAAALPPSAV
jgi:PAS domain S-box-containing protein